MTLIKTTGGLPFLQSSGGLVTIKDLYVLLVFKRQKWDMPKGIIEPNDTDIETAIREVGEESGLHRDLLVSKGKLPSTYHITTHRHQRHLKKTHWFWLAYHGKKSDARPQIEEGIVECKWVKISKLSNYTEHMQVRVLYVVDFWHRNLAYAPRR